MAHLNIHPARGAQPESMAFCPPGIDKLDRLRELRAAIDCLRSEREMQDPLLAWIVERERAENA